MPRPVLWVRAMRRREFIAALGSAAAWPVAARAQQPVLPVIGYLSGATFEAMYDWLTAFKQSLAETGFTEGRDVAIEYRWADGHNDRLPELAADLAGRGLAVIAVGASTPGALAGGDSDNPDRFWYRYRPGQNRSRRKPRASWRQCHRCDGGQR
jgi:hypothetical protein